MEIKTLEQALEVILQQQARIEKLSALIEKQGKVIAQLREEIAKLKSNLRQYNNPNTPSSQIPLHLKEKLEHLTLMTDEEPPPSNQAASNKRTKRDKPTRSETHSVKHCPGCGSKHIRLHKKVTPRVIIHLQMPEAESVEHLPQKYTCADCGEIFEAPIPDAIPNSKFDLNISLLAMLLHAIGTTQSKTVRMLGWFGVGMCEASVNNIIHRMYDYLGDERYNQLEEELRGAFFACKDETGWRHKGKNRYLLVAATAKTVFYRMVEGRGQKHIRKLPRTRVSGCDGYRAYDEVENELQRCWAHLFRRLRDPAITFDEQEGMKQFVRMVKRVTRLYRSAKKEKRRGIKIKRMYEKKLDRILKSQYKEEPNLVEAFNYIISYHDDWFTFLKYWGVEPTNNRAERALRPMVVQRKVSQHSQSEHGLHGLEVIQSIYQTCHARGENFAEILRHDVEVGLNERRNS